MVRREASGVKSNHALDQLELDPDTGETVSCRWGDKTHFCKSSTTALDGRGLDSMFCHPQWKSCAIADERRQDGASFIDCEAAS